MVRFYGNIFNNKKKPGDGEHSHGGILFEYEFFANVIEIRETARLMVTQLLRLCAVFGGVFATSCLSNDII
ncbi:hypothetical protein KIN20_020073 [Parelaphostrongylus tenuis]|uniref:Endoplasmic reticulum vesicle transporter C-terminal domain-containing protein n=1 Tax=Parelaphostrongylus tenuis TaxID=148309 RepID=A0AAD5MLX8_PARTN|nr:hypothetical protein KIN20_020073 [Parelaphostrongylus tenuis]